MGIEEVHEFVFLGSDYGSRTPSMHVRNAPEKYGLVNGLQMACD